MFTRGCGVPCVLFLAWPPRVNAVTLHRKCLENVTLELFTSTMLISIIIGVYKIIIGL